MSARTRHTSADVGCRKGTLLTAVIAYPSILAGPLIVLMLSSLVVAGCDKNFNVGTATCLACHDGRSAPDKRALLEGRHAQVDCELCHGPGFLHVRNGGRGGLFIRNPAYGAFDESYAVCTTCHEAQVNGYLLTRHAALDAARCGDCHDVHTRGGMQVSVESPLELDNDGYGRLCGPCHESQVEGFLESGHAVLGVAICGACHDAHKPDGLSQDTDDNTLCLQCHGSFELGFDSEERINAHTGLFHSVDPAGSGASRCTACHLPPLEQFPEYGDPHDHTLFTVPPAFSNEAMDMGIEPAPPNSCAGIPGCHDADVPDSGLPHDVNDRDENATLQLIYETIGGDPREP